MVLEPATEEKAKKEQEIVAKFVENDYKKIHVHFVSGEKYVLRVRGSHVYVREGSSCAPYTFISTNLSKRLHERICGKNYVYYYE